MVVTTTCENLTNFSLGEIITLGGNFLVFGRKQKSFLIYFEISTQLPTVLLKLLQVKKQQLISWLDLSKSVLNLWVKTKKLHIFNQYWLYFRICSFELIDWSFLSNNVCWFYYEYKRTPLSNVRITFGSKKYLQSSQCNQF